MTHAFATPTVKIFTYELGDVIRSKWILLYALFFFAVTEALFWFGGTGTQVLLSLTNVVLLLIPLVSILFGTMYLYQAREFIELMLAQPVERRQLFVGLYAGLALPLAAAFSAGLVVPFLLHGFDGAGHARTLGVMLLAGTLLTFTFVALALLVATYFDDRVKGFGVTLLLWLFGTVIYDGLVLAAAYALADYPLEPIMIALTLLNPVDLARVLLLLHFDVSALMGYTGAVFERFFGSGLGVGLSVGALMLWWIVPLAAAGRRFERRDF